MPSLRTKAPLVSVIIPCFNHGAYLAEAIESVRSQNYPHKEIIVVDDGSTDNTKEVSQQFAEVKYIYQGNQGLSAARNTGIAQSAGNYLVFLDADDWLLPGALMTNLQYLESNPGIAFVSGGYKLTYVPENKTWDVTRELSSHHYCHLLQGNYIGMHAAVMFPRRVFAAHRYDITLKACEDYDLYLRLARDHPVLHHTGLLAMYRVHTENMSGNYLLMRQTALTVLKRQREKLRSADEREALQSGLNHFNRYYTEKIYDRLVHNVEIGRENENREIIALWRYNRALFWQYRGERRRLLRKKGLLFHQRLAGRLRLLLKQERY